MTELTHFAKRFNQSDDAKPATRTDIEKFEQDFGIFLPNDYRIFLSNFGNIWTPDILNLVVDKELEINDVQNFWNIDKIIYDNQNEWTSQIVPEIIPFASDCMGNIFAFLRDELKSPKESAHVYFYDHDFNTVEKVSSSFKRWIEQFNHL